MRRSMVMVMMALVLVFTAACGSSNNGSSNNGASNNGNASGSNAAATTPADNGAAAAPAEAEATGTLAEVLMRGKIIIGTTANYPPYNYIDANGELKGYDIEWGNIIAEGLGVEAEYVTGQFAGLIPGLTSKRYDILSAAVNVTEERKQSVDFSIPYSLDGAVAVIMKGSGTVSDITEIEGKIVGVNAGSVWETTIKKIGGYKEVKTYPGAPEAFADLRAGRIDVVAVGTSVAADYIMNSEKGDQLEVAGVPYETKDVAMVLRKNDDDLKKRIDEIIQSKKDDGTYKALAKQYFGQEFNN